MALKNKQLITTLLLAGVLVAAAIIYTATKHSNTKPASTAQVSSQGPAGTTQTVVSPPELSQNISKYANKPVAVRGYIEKTSAGYIIVDNADKPSKAAFTVDVSKVKTQLPKYFVKTSYKTDTAVTIQGTLKADATTAGLSHIVIVVDSFSS